MRETDSPQYQLAARPVCEHCGLEADIVVLPSGAELADCARCRTQWVLPQVHQL